MDNIKQVVKDVRFLIATDCCDKTIQSRIENFINEREQALRIHDVVGRSEQLPEDEEETKCPDHTPYWGVCSTCGQY
jgi:hypothetical protein